MTTVFISGSMPIKKLDADVRSRIDNIIDSAFDVIIGDADGVDCAAQRYLHERKYSRAVVFCSGNAPRNNIGDWRTNVVSTSCAPGTRAFFTAKDIAMVSQADFGLMVWDCRSTGTLSNVFELLARKKKFITVSEPAHLTALLVEMSETARTKAEQKIGIENRLAALLHEQAGLFA